MQVPACAVDEGQSLEPPVVVGAVSHVIAESRKFEKENFNKKRNNDNSGDQGPT